MSPLIESPRLIAPHGNLPKRIEEFVGLVNTETDEVSVARMSSPAGWTEPGQRPDFDEVTLVLEGEVVVETEDGRFRLGPGQAFLARRGEWVRYGTPEGAVYVAVCVPAFSPDRVHRDAD